MNLNILRGLPTVNTICRENLKRERNGAISAVSAPPHKLWTSRKVSPSNTSPFIVSMSRRSVAGPPYPVRPGPLTLNIRGPSLVPLLGRGDILEGVSGEGRGALAVGRGGHDDKGEPRGERAYPRGCGGGPARQLCAFPTRARTMGGARPRRKPSFALGSQEPLYINKPPKWCPSVPPGDRKRLPVRS